MSNVIWLGRNAFEAGLMQGLAGKPLPWTRPAWYNYNGTKLPALPRWNTEAYPYALLLCIEPEEMKYGILYLMSGPVKVVGDQLIAQEDINVRAFHNQPTNTAVDGGLNYWRPIESWSKTEGEVVAYFASAVIWSNFDLYAQGSVTSYLYNGVALPALPEYDTEAYPYATIYKYDITYELVVRKAVNYDYSQGLMRGDAIIFHITPATQTDWSQTNEIDNYPNTISLSKWSNFDILNEDGTVYLAASDPVPVYDDSTLYLSASTPTPWEETDELWETLFEGEVTTVAGDLNGAEYELEIAEHLFWGNERIRLTVNGVSAIYTSESDLTYAEIGNDWLNGMANTTIADDGTDYYVASSQMASWYYLKIQTRTPGTYIVKIERALDAAADDGSTEDTSTDSSGTTEGGTTGDSGSTDSTDQDNELPFTPVE